MKFFKNIILLKKINKKKLNKKGKHNQKSHYQIQMKPKIGKIIFNQTLKEILLDVLFARNIQFNNQIKNFAQIKIVQVTIKLQEKKMSLDKIFIDFKQIDNLQNFNNIVKNVTN